MTTNQEYVVDTEQLVEDYQSFLGYVNNYFKLNCKLPTSRVLREILTLHIKGTLDNRIFNMFRQLAEDWEFKFLEMLTDYNLSDSDTSKLLNSTAYCDLKLSTESITRQVYQGNDPNFTIWEVEPASDLSYVIISACGDYRIEQWHHEHHVTKLEIKDVVSYDMSHLVGFIHKTFAFSAAPAKITYYPSERTKVAAPKKRFYEQLVKEYVGYKLGERKSDEARFLSHIDALGKEMVVNPLDIEAKLLALDSFFELEVRLQLDKMSDFKSVSSFTISGEEIVVNFGNYKSQERKTASFEELELQAAEANGDYIPERQRKHRG